MTSRGERFSVHLANNGTTNIPLDHASCLLPSLRESLPKGEARARRRETADPEVKPSLTIGGVERHVLAIAAIHAQDCE